MREPESVMFHLKSSLKRRSFELGTLERLAAVYPGKRIREDGQPGCSEDNYSSPMYRGNEYFIYLLHEEITKTMLVY